ncbi:MAG: carboxypeptidase regulatory-like domain-containing protein [Chloroflexota bacterium]
MLLLFGFTTPAYAHGVVITYSLQSNGEVQLEAEFDTGEPMAEAQVTVYSPEDPLTPWLIGTADEVGRYTFVIDPDVLGLWDIQYRKAGHGDFTHVQLDEGMIDRGLMTQSPGELVPPTVNNSASTNTEDRRPATLQSGGNISTSGGFTSLQILLMSASVIWGFVGTALYFSNKPTQAHDHTHDHHH